MLTEREIDSLKPGYYPNSLLRSKFGKKHGSPVLERFKVGVDQDGNDKFRDMIIIGNRSQRRWRAKNPLRQLPVKNQPEQFFTNRFEKKQKVGWLAKVMAFFATLFSKKK